MIFVLILAMVYAICGDIYYNGLTPPLGRRDLLKSIVINSFVI